jgi:hypothetical protein
MAKKITITKDKAYMVFMVYAKSIRDVETDKVSISDKLLDAFLPFISIGVRYSKAVSQIYRKL